MPTSSTADPIPLEQQTARRAQAEDRECRVLEGRDDLLKYQPLLAELCELTGQSGEADNLEHFLTTAAALRKRPCMILFKPISEEYAPTVGGYSGAVVLFEYLAAGVGLRIYATSDFSGRRNVIGQAWDRARLCVDTWTELRRRGAHAVFFNYQASSTRTHRLDEIAELVGHSHVRSKWSLLETEFPMYLPLASTIDATLARIGQKTRANLRYYKRRAEVELGCTFVAEATLSLAEYLAFNRVGAFPVPDQVAAARYKARSTLKQPFRSGIQTGDGQWLSVVTGWKRGRSLEIEWQINRADLPRYSIATVMRAFLVEHAIAQGFERLYIEGGTQQPIQQSFQKETVQELTILRRSAYAWGLHRFAQRIFPKDNHLGRILAASQVPWHANRRPDY